MGMVEVLVNFKMPDGTVLLSAGTRCEPACGEYRDGSIDICFPWDREDGITLERGQWRWVEAGGDSDA